MCVIIVWCIRVSCSCLLVFNVLRLVGGIGMRLWVKVVWLCVIIGWLSFGMLVCFGCFRLSLMIVLFGICMVFLDEVWL